MQQKIKISKIDKQTIKKSILCFIYSGQMSQSESI